MSYVKFFDLVTRNKQTTTKQKKRRKYAQNPISGQFQLSKPLKMNEQKEDKTNL